MKLTSPRKILGISILAALLGTPATISAGATAPEVVIVVNKNNKIEAVSARQLKAIFSGEKARWPDGEKIQTLATAADAPEHRAAIRFLFGMSEAEYQKYCIHANFVGNPQAVPRASGPSKAVVNLVGLIPGAIGFASADAINPNVRVLHIDGGSIGDADLVSSK